MQKTGKQQAMDKQTWRRVKAAKNLKDQKVN